MQFIIDQWQEADYQGLLQELRNLSEPAYLAFHQKLVPGTEGLLGIRIPKLRALAKQIGKGNAPSFLNIALSHTDYYESTMLTGMVIGGLKTDLTTVLSYVERFVPKIDNWAVCDTFCSSLKIVKQNRAVFFDLIKKYAASSEEYEVRFAFVLLLSYYVDDTVAGRIDYLQAIFQLCNANRHQGYYVKMAVAWLLSLCFIKFQPETIAYFTNCKLDNWTYNKALQKIVESNQVDQETKQMVKGMKR